MNDNRTIALVAGVLALLAAATAVGQFLKRHPDRGLDPAAVRTFNSRLRGWWILCTVLAAAFWLGTTATVVLFGLVSFWALREFITLTPTRKGDHRALFWVFFLFTPLHYVLVGLNRYDVFSVFLPVYATLFVLAASPSPATTSASWNAPPRSRRASSSASTACRSRRPSSRSRSRARPRARAATSGCSSS